MAIDHIDPLEQEFKREEIIKRRGSVSKSSRLACVRFIKDNVLQRNYGHSNRTTAVERNAFNAIAGIMQKRLTDEEFAKEYGFLSSEDVESGFGVSYQASMSAKGFLVGLGEGDGFVQISEAENKPDFDTAITTKRGKQFQIMPKEYFTFIPMGDNKDMVMEEAKKFYEVAMRAFEKAQAVARINKTKISFKIKMKIGELVNDTDSLVVYASDLNGARIARSIFRKELKSSGLKVARFGRSDSGFDAWDGKEKISHRQLVAKAVTKNIVHDYQNQQNLLCYSEDQLDNYVQRGIESYSKFSPERLLETI